MKTDLATFLLIDRLHAPETPMDDLFAALDHDEWQVRQAALGAIARRPAAAAIAPILSLLDDQDSRDLYGAPNHWDVDGAPDEATTEDWRCRFRLKQAACLALGAIAAEIGPETLGETAIRRLAHYATSQDDDYTVRAAACKALSKVGKANPIARDALTAASTDGEWCTRTEAAMALAR